MQGLKIEKTAENITIERVKKSTKLSERNIKCSVEIHGKKILKIS